MGGGTAYPYPELSGSQGLSPRGRGNRPLIKGDHAQERSIPAWAGEPPKLPVEPRLATVYPRVGGGTCGCRCWALSEPGLSPRGRGNHEWDRAQFILYGSIPAWAGEPNATHTWIRPSRVYPRVGGGTGDHHPAPRRGNGLSPRGRGNLLPDDGHAAPEGSIPAWAGEPAARRPRHGQHGVYPRVGGGT